MKEKKTDQQINPESNKNIERRALVKNLSAAALAGIAINSTAASAQESRSGRNFEPWRHQEDAWMGEMPGVHRVFIDTSFPAGGSDALRYAFNILNAHGDAYSGKDADYALVVCYRHMSTPFAYEDAVWEKYGEIFHELMDFPDPDTGKAPKKNLMKTASGPFKGSSLGDLGERGVRYAICNMATMGIAGMLADRTGAETDDVYQELVAGAIPHSRFVPAGVMATTRAQEYGYSLLYAG